MTDTDLAPTVHINGTSKDELIAGFANQYEALTDVLRCMERYAPHARDYYVLAGGGSKFKAAMDAHVKRIEAIVQMREDLYAMLEKVQDQ
jgi:hypothetical protein